MMGEVQQREKKLFYYGVDLEKRVREEHPLRRVKELVDFSFVREQVKDCYGQNGHQSEDPIVIMKLMLLLFLDAVKSERELMRIVGERLDYMWFLGFDLEDEIPDHSVLSKARRKWGEEVFEELFVGIVRQCVEAGLVDGGKIYMDGSLVNANASKESIRRGPVELMEALRQTYRREEAKLEVRDEGGPQTISRTDPDAAIVRKGVHDAARPRYKHHRVVDDAEGVITAIETTPGDINENEKFDDLIQQHETNTAQQVHTVVADSQYGTNANFATCGEQNIRAHMGDLKRLNEGKSTREGIFSETEFHYDEATDSYTCPAGERLTRRRYEPQRQRYVYGISAKICDSCSLKSFCTRSHHGRTIKRHRKHVQIQKARLQAHMFQAKLDLRRRKHLIEGSFADAANNHHFKKARWRRLPNQKIQDWLIATCQNIRILMRCGRVPAATAAAISSKIQSLDVVGWVHRARHPHHRLAVAALFRTDLCHA